MHCASLGEFEQGRPVLEKLKETHPHYKILLTFFSPSGYEVRKSYADADWAYYLPLDTKANARKFIGITQPQLAVFVKYEYWYHYLHQLHQAQIPTILISALFRENAVFFKWYGVLHRKMLGLFTHIFVQNESSFTRIENLMTAKNLSLAGDTRFDRVSAIAATFAPIARIAHWVQNKQVIVAGSTWPDDEHCLKHLLHTHPNILLIIAPHEISDNHIQLLQALFPDAVLYSEMATNKNHEPSSPGSNVLIINNIGMLSKLYYYGTVCYVGGGFNKSGIHNTLEAAVYGKPVLFGSNYAKFAEAVGLIQHKGAISFSQKNELADAVKLLLTDEDVLQSFNKNAKNYVMQHTGATIEIINWLQRNVFR